MEPSKKLVVSGRCFCGRIAGPARTLQRKSIQLRAPFCPQNLDDGQIRCALLSTAERAQPGIQAWFTRCPPYAQLDEGVQSTVLYLHQHGVSTIGSCDGHLKREPYLLFYDEPSARSAMALLDYEEPVLHTRIAWHPVLPVVYQLRFPKALAEALEDAADADVASY